jgi:hypothetical protein
MGKIMLSHQVIESKGHPVNLCRKYYKTPFVLYKSEYSKNVNFYHFRLAKIEQLPLWKKYKCDIE